MDHGHRIPHTLVSFRQWHPYGHGDPLPLMAPPTVAFELPAPMAFATSIKVSICGPVAPLSGVRPGSVRTPVVLAVVMRTELPACHAPLTVFPVTCAHQLAVTPPPLLPGATTMPRRNSGAPVVSGSVMVLLVNLPIEVPFALVTELTKLMP